LVSDWPGPNRDHEGKDDVTSTKPITQRERELLGMASVASQMPVDFANGARWVELTGECKFCAKDIPADLLRGAVTRPLRSVAVVEAVGVCADCRIATTFLYRMYDDMRLTAPREGGWQTWHFVGTAQGFAWRRSMMNIRVTRE
jgi:hypothetical protein